MSKKQKLFHCTVAFHGLGEARIDNLTQEQAWQVQDILRLIEQKPPRYSANGCLLYHVTTELADKRQAVIAGGGFLSRLMWRINAWMMGAVFIACLLAPEAFAQEKLRPRVVEPIRVALTMAGESEEGREFNNAMRAELNKLRRVVFTDSNGDYDVRMAVARDGECDHFVVATVIVTRSSGRFGLSIDTGASLRQVAERVASKLDADFFQRRQGGMEEKK